MATRRHSLFHHDELQHAVAKIPATEILIPVGEWNGHVGIAAGVHSDAHGGLWYT